MTEILQRVARVIADQLGATCRLGEEIETLDDFRSAELDITNGVDLIEMARAVVGAMREPTDAMDDAGGNRGALGYDPAPAAVWRAMIEAALND